MTIKKGFVKAKEIKSVLWGLYNHTLRKSKNSLDSNSYDVTQQSVPNIWLIRNDTLT